MLVWFVLLLLAFLWFFSRKEGFSVKISADGAMVKSVHKGLKGLVGQATKQAAKMRDRALKAVPFQPQLRQWHRKLFKKNIGLSYA
jgi:hypothetical protein